MSTSKMIPIDQFRMKLAPHILDNVHASRLEYYANFYKLWTQNQLKRKLLTSFFYILLFYRCEVSNSNLYLKLRHPTRYS